jgi:hypothetical protein
MGEQTMTTVLHTRSQGLRVHKLANLGGLVAIAGLENIDSAVLLGAFLEMLEQLSQLSSHQLNVLREAGLQKLRERNSEKRAYKQRKDPSESQTEISMSIEDIKKIITKLNGKIPVFEKDIILELLRLIR